MSDLKAKTHQIRFQLGLRARPRWGSLQERGEEREGKAIGRQGGMGRKRREEEWEKETRHTNPSVLPARLDGHVVCVQWDKLFARCLKV